ncbi:unnamed protein product [Paramecium primaurelia]|uniref:Uncharacterized protein n=1 Tax=Paramecium primaurelia TaxID=5886 RepID=A0A8S1PBI8_PARPR|nr:unnamed protein product [Paramecium primaurelia]
MPQETIEIQMLKQQVQLLQQELQQIHQYCNIRTLWNNIFSKLETITYTSKEPLKIYQQLMFRQSLSQDQIKPEYLTQDEGCQIDDDQIKFNVQDIIKSSIQSINIELEIQQDKYLQNNFNQIEIKIKIKIIHQFISLYTNYYYQFIQKQNYITKSISNLEQEVKDFQINDLKIQNQALKQDISNLQLNMYIIRGKRSKIKTLKIYGIESSTIKQ